MEQSPENVDGQEEKDEQLPDVFQELTVTIGDQWNRGVENAPNQERGDIDYSYVPEDVVKQLKSLALATGMSQFVLNLENAACENSRDEQSEVVDKRSDQAKVEFIKKCFIKEYGIEERLREHLWKYVKGSLNRRVYAKRSKEKKKAKDEKIAEEKKEVMNQLIESVESLKTVAGDLDRLSLAMANLLGPAKKQKRKAANPGEDPLSQDQENFTYNYVSRERVTALAILCEQDLERFVLLLEEEVYKEYPWDMDKIVDNRHNQEHVDFIRECVFKHYEVPERLRKYVWQALKECLNKRVMEKQTKA